MEARIMFSSRIFGNDVDKSLQYAKDKGFAGIEWYLNSFRLSTNQQTRAEFFAKLDQHSDLYFTFHLPTTDVELAHKDELIAEASLKYLQMNVEYLSAWFSRQNYRSLLTLHVGSNSISTADLAWNTALKNLARLGEFVSARNAQLLLENLKMGWTTEAEKHLELVKETNVGITFDTGHAASNALVRSGKLCLLNYVDQLALQIRHVHFYAYESLDRGRHIPPTAWEEIEQVWQKVLDLPQASSIVLELSTQRELEQTLDLLLANKAKW